MFVDPSLIVTSNFIDICVELKRDKTTEIFGEIFVLNTLDQHKVKSNVSMNVKWKRNEMREELMNQWNKNERETKEKFIVILFDDRKGKEESTITMRMSREKKDFCLK